MKKEKCDKAGEFGMCPFVTSQKLLQGKWALLILHLLSDGAKRFGELRREIDITQATLAVQLKPLEEEGLISRKVFSRNPSTHRVLEGKTNRK